MELAYRFAIALDRNGIQQRQSRAFGVLAGKMKAQSFGCTTTRHIKRQANYVVMTRRRADGPQRDRFVGRIEHSAGPRGGVAGLYRTYLTEDVGAQIVAGDLAGRDSFDVGATFHGHPAPSPPFGNGWRTDTQPCGQFNLTAADTACPFERFDAAHGRNIRCVLTYVSIGRA